MGVTIHYKGYLKPKVNREEVVDVIRDMANSLNWNVKDIEDKENEFLGIIAQPHPNSEPLGFVFTSDGQLINLLMFGHNKENNVEPAKDNLVEHCSCKTQYSTPATHISIIKLLEFLQKQYFQEMEIYDDGGYYPDGDTEELIHRIDKINHAMDIMEEALNKAEFSKSESDVENIKNLTEKLEKIFEQIFIKLKKNMK